MLPDFIFHHIGVATPDIDATSRFYTEAGFIKSETVEDPLQNVKICFLEKITEGNQHPVIELIEPIDESSPINRIIKTSGVSPYHFCYIVKDLEASMKQLRRMRFVIVSPPKSACALGNRRVCFLFNKVVGLVELVEE